MESLKQNKRKKNLFKLSERKKSEEKNNNERACGIQPLEILSLLSFNDKRKFVTHFYCGVVVAVALFSFFFPLKTLSTLQNQYHSNVQCSSGTYNNNEKKVLELKIGGLVYCTPHYWFICDAIIEIYVTHFENAQ